MTAWVNTMTGNILAPISGSRRHVPFTVLFKAIFGFALAGILLVGAGFVLVDDNVAARIMVPLQVVAALAGAAVGAIAAWRAGKDAPTN
jgi:hypothetical protein